MDSMNKLDLDSPPDRDDQPDTVWGAAAIGDVIGVNSRQAFYMLENRQLPATKIGRRWCASRRRLRQRVEAES